MESIVVCHRCGRPRPESVASPLGGSCPYCLLAFAFSDEPLAADSEDSRATTLGAQLPPDLVRLGPYTILGPLGTGGMGSVFKARHEALGRIVALKLLKTEFAQRPGFPERFQREGQTLAAMTHLRIIGVHDLGCDCGIYYLAMEYVDGITLRERLRRGPLSIAEASGLLTEMCAALRYAHERGIVHCDIKPENVLLDQSGHAKIADFGIAKLAGAGFAAGSPATEAPVVAGTRSYMAPEQLTGGTLIDARADLYALGVVLHEMLTGELPPDGFARSGDEMPLNVALGPTVPPALTAAMRAVLAPEPNERPHDVQAFQDMIERALFPQRAANRGRRLLWGLGVAGLASTVVLLVVVRGEKSPSPPAAAASSPKRVAAMPHAVVLEHGARLWDVKFLPSSPLVATSGEDGFVKFWDLHRAEPIAKLAAYPRGELGYLRLAFSPTHPQLATAGGDNLVRLWNFTNNKQMTFQEGPVLTGHGREISAIAYSPDGKRLATASHDRTVRLWEAQQGTLITTLTGLPDPALCVAFSPDGASVAAGAMNGAIRMWDANGRVESGIPGHGKRAWALAFSPLGDLLISGSHDQTIRIVDVAQRKVREVLRTPGVEVWSLAITQDGKLLAAGTHDGSVRMWNLAEGTLLANRKIHAAPVVSVAFSTDGMRLASASLDQTSIVSLTAELLAKGP